MFQKPSKPAFPGHATYDRSLGQAIRKAREATGDSLRQTAVQLDISPGYLSKVERDKEKPSRDLLERIAFELSMDTDPLLRLAGYVPSRIEKQFLNPPQWSKEWPTDPGWYWFMLKGWMELRLGRCHIEEDTPYFIYRGQPIAKQEGVWTPAILPDTAGAVALLEGEE